MSTKHVGPGPARFQLRSVPEREVVYRQKPVYAPAPSPWPHRLAGMFAGGVLIELIHLIF